MYHKPVLIEESIEGLNIKPDGIYVDATFGGGGHSREILNRLNNKGRLIAIDRDKDAKENIPGDQRFSFIHGNFRYIKNYLYHLDIDLVDGIIADLGVSSHQFDERRRGFSFRLGGDMDMRMNNEQVVTAAYVLNNYEKDDLVRVFKDYSDIRNPLQLSERIISNRQNAEFKDIESFLELISDLIPKNKEIKYTAQVFQALRIEVNDEVNLLEIFLNSCADVLMPGGRLVVISYHSVEDRLVKNLIKSGNTDGLIEKDIFGNSNLKYDAINKKVIIPSAEEISENNRAKSAKLRIAERL